MNTETQDYLIMKLRTLARLRGATPAEIQRNVLILESPCYDASEIAERATRAALDTIDSLVPLANSSRGPLGDALAYRIHAAIERAVSSHYGNPTLRECYLPERDFGA